MLEDNITTSLHTQDNIAIILDLDEFDLLLVTLGYATGAAMNNSNVQLAYRILDLANRVNRNNPEFMPYRIPGQYGLDEKSELPI